NTSNTKNSTNPVQSTGSISVSLGKESESVSLSSSETPIVRELGKDVPLPKEVISSGVKMQSASVTLPKAVSSLGVKPVGNAVPVSNAPSIVLPLSDDQITSGLHKGVADSIRWLSEWCVRRLRQVHLAIRSIGGKTVRVQE
ncbi:hypothetical protein HY947_01035, partial [Candidatus Gottesmanbacteria bacterium]|nr:hypothetical protein [Candidatus Gottesmanbacteria bacterium]